MALEIGVAAVIGIVLIVGPQIWTVGEWLKQFRLPAAASRAAAPAVQPPSGPVTGARPQQPALVVVTKPQVPVPIAVTGPQPPALAVATGLQPSTPAAAPPPTLRPKAPGIRPRRAPTPRAAYAPILTEPKANSRTYYEALMRQGVDLYQSGWYGPAMGRFRLAATVIPTSASAHLWIGRAGIRAGRYTEAQKALQRVIALAPSSEAARQARVLLEEIKL